MTDSANGLYETATYCKPNDEKRPSVVGLPDFTTQQVCPEMLSQGASEVTNAFPDGWYVRIMFDELLDPDIEELTPVLDDTGMETGTYEGHIANTHPVTLQCQSVNGGALVDVDYDGYYSPSGNRVTWPVGPSLVIKPNDPTLIATNTECQVKINDNVVDKDGNQVPSDQRIAFKFKTAPIQVTLIDPPDDPDGATPIDALQLYYDNPYIQFNTAVDIDTLCTDADAPTDYGAGLCDNHTFEFSPESGYCDDGTGLGSFATCKSFADCPSTDTICGKGFCNLTGSACNKDTDCPTGEHCDAIYWYSYLPYGFTDREYGVGPVNPIPADISGTFGFVAGVKLKDRCGVESTMTSTAADQTLVHFTTNAFALNKTNIADGEKPGAAKRQSLMFNNVVDLQSIERTEWTLTPAPTIPPSATGCVNVGTTKNPCDPANPDARFECISGNCVQNLTTSSGGDVVFRGYFQPGTEYTLTVNASAEVKDFYGDPSTFTAAKTTKWTPAPIAITSFSPADNAVVTKATTTSAVGVTMTFNQHMDLTTLTSADYSFVDSTGADVAGLTVSVGTASNACGASSSGCQLRVRGVLAPGAYKFTLKGGAVINDKLSNMFTQAADKVIHFTVKEADVVPPSQCL